MNLSFVRKNFLPLLIAAQLLSALLGVVGFWGFPGWPGTHEYTSTAVRVFQFADAWRAGDWLPIWSTAENYGLGSPMPLYYPRLFTTITMIFFLCGVGIKTALVLTSMLFGMIGGAGLYGCCRILRLPRCWAAGLSLLFIHLNYAQTDLMVRGAMAEFTAMALLPLLAAWSLLVMLRGDFRWWGVLVGLGLFFGHPTILATALPLPATALVIAYSRHPARRSELLKRTILGGLAGAAVVGPWVLLWQTQKENFIFEIGYLLMNNPRYFFVSVREFLLNFLFYERHGNSINPQLDLGFLLGFLVLAGIAGCALYRSAALRQRWRRHWPELLVIGGCVILYFLFMNRITWPIYRRSYFLITMQFPWRLLAPASVLGVVLYALFLRLLRGVLSDRKLALLVWLPLLLTLGGSLLHQYRLESRLTWQEFTRQNPVNWIEYVPMVPKFKDDCDPNEWRILIDQWLQYHAQRPPEFFGTPAKIEIVPLADRRSWQITSISDQPFIVELPIIWSDLLLITPQDGSGRLPGWRSLENPRLRFAVPAGSQQIRVDVPSWRTVWRRNHLPLLPSALPPQ